MILSGLVPFVSWKGESATNLGKSARRSLVVAAVILGIAFASGARQALSLVLIFLCAFAADMNIRAVIRKARNGKFGGAGGYLAHVGVGIFLAGVVISGVYARSTRVTLPVNKPVAVAGSTLTFLRVVPGTATAKQAMEVKVVSADGKTAFVYPKMYVNTKTNQMMANPAIRNSPLFDFYVAPQSYDPGQPERIGRELRLQKGTTTNVDGTGFTFRDFSADRSAMMRGEKTVLILTDFIITPPDGSRHDATIRSVFHLDGAPPDTTVADVPGIAGAKMEVLAVSPDDGAVVLRVQGVSKNPKDEFQAATTESLSVDVTRKPFIGLVWGGFYVMMAGALLALFKRAREASRATAAAAETASPRPDRPEPLPAAGPGPVPLHTRSRL